MVNIWYWSIAISYINIPKFFNKINTENIFISLYWTSMYWSLFFSVYFLLLITLFHRYTISVSVSALYVSVLHIQREWVLHIPKTNFCPLGGNITLLKILDVEEVMGGVGGERKTPLCAWNVTSNNSFDIVRVTCEVGIIIFILQMIKHVWGHKSVSIRW